MSTLTIELPESLKKRIEAVAARERYTVSQFLASAAGEKLAVVLTTTCTGKRMPAVARTSRSIWPRCRTWHRPTMTVSTSAASELS